MCTNEQLKANWFGYLIEGLDFPFPKDGWLNGMKMGPLPINQKNLNVLIIVMNT